MKANKKRLAKLGHGSGRKVELWEKEFGLVSEAIDYSLGLYGKELSQDDYEDLYAKVVRPVPAGLTYFTERISLGNNRWIVRVSTWIPKE